MKRIYIHKFVHKQLTIKLSMSESSDNTTVQVALRIRPLIEHEISKGFQNILEVFPDLNQIRIKNSDKAFTYNYVFDVNVEQDVFYKDCVQNMIQNLFKGYNVTILAYGQTGSGKTYSMGTSYDSKVNNKGVIPCALTDIFNHIKDNFTYDFAVSISFMELYQEVLYDLLSTKPRDQCVVEIREDAKSIIIPGLTEQPITSSSEALKYLMKGSQGRATSSTNMNAQSSRSHAIFTINISMQKKNDSNVNRTAKFHLVDLAGSERSKKTGATGQTFKEGVNINKGLLALGNVISALGDDKTQNGYISYRDSNLTRLLKDSLGGNSITLMIACVSPADYNLEETVSTLRYADRARKIKNKPIINQDPKVAEINRLHKLVQNLRLELVGQGGPIICQAELELLKKEASDLKQKNHLLNIKLSSSLSDNTVLFERIHLLESRNEELLKKLKEIQDEYNITLNNLNHSIERSDVSAIKDTVNKLESIQAHLTDINSEQLQTMKELRKHEADNYRSISGDESNSESEINEEQEVHTAQQIALNTELQEVMRKLVVKERLAEYISANTCYTVDHNMIADCENKIALLEKEKQELLQQLKSVHSTGVNAKIAEQRRKRVQELETQIQDLNKKVTEQARLIKLKEKDEEKMRQLNQEIVSMKKMKVDLMKKMKTESEKFRVWKNQRERELLKLKEQDRKRLNQINKLETMHTRQQNVLKRKVEEAAAINKRLKDALAKRKAVQDMKANAKGDRVVEWINHELELHVNTLDAQLTLNGLLEDRALLHKQLDQLKSEVDEDSPDVKQLEDEIALRSTQIQDLQQKILDSDEGSKTQNRFDNIQTMGDAKQALKTLFDAVATIKKSTFATENKLQELENVNAEMRKENQDLVSTFKQKELDHINNQREYEEKITILLKRVEVEGLDEQTKRILNIQQSTMDNLQKENRDQALEIESLKKRIEQIQDVATQETTLFSRPTKKTAKVPEENGSGKVIVEPYYADNIVESDESFEDNTDMDPDWRKTPLARKIQKIRNTTYLQPQDRLKRSSEGGCTCKGNCSTRNCGCRKITKSCTGNCKCTDSLCSNRDKSPSDSGDKENKEDSKIPQLLDSSDEFAYPRTKLKTRRKLPLNQ
ncbi:kinesin-4B [Trypoxylus dichotomus]